MNSAPTEFEEQSTRETEVYPKRRNRHYVDVQIY